MKYYSLWNKISWIFSTVILVVFFLHLYASNVDDFQISSLTSLSRLQCSHSTNMLFRLIEV